jgi:DNA-binding response OmpR family regulator
MNSLLVIDDDPVHRMIIARLGTQAGMHVMSASSASDARKMLVENKFRCVTLELNLGDEEGASVLQTLAESIPAPKVMLIRLPAGHGPLDARRREAARWWACPSDTWKGLH